MNWYKSARRNPYEQLANKFANKFFEWFIQQPYATHYDGNENQNQHKNELGFTNISLTKEDLYTIGIKDSVSEDLYLSMEIHSIHQKRKPFIISATAYGSQLSYPSENVTFLPIISVLVRLNKMNQKLWHQFRQKLHEVLRHEFEHINQSVNIMKTPNQYTSETISAPKDQKPNEFLDMKKQLFDIQLQLYSVSDRIKADKTIPELDKQEIENKIRRHSKIIDYMSDSAELEAYATSAYYDARKKGTTVEQEVNTIVQDRFIDDQYSYEDIDLLAYEAGNIIIHWMLRFVENRYPEYSKQRGQQPV